MSVDWKTFVLPEKSALDPAQGLAAFLQANRTNPVRLQAQAMTAIDTRLLQYLIAAARDWQGRALDFVVTDVSPRLGTEFARIGLTTDHLTWQGEIA
jgi:anti-anti-sigma regulatory factor